MHPVATQQPVSPYHFISNQHKKDTITPKLTVRNHGQKLKDQIIIFYPKVAYANIRLPGLNQHGNGDSVELDQEEGEVSQFGQKTAHLYCPRVRYQLLSRINCLRSCGLLSGRFLCPWDFPRKNTGVGCHFLLQGIFPTQGSNPCALHPLHCRRILYHYVTQQAHIQRNQGNSRKTIYRDHGIQFHHFTANIRGKIGSSDRFYFLGLQNHCGQTTAMKFCQIHTKRRSSKNKNKKMLAPWKESYAKPRQCIKKQRHHFANKDPYSQSYGFSSSHVWM